jgi:hypothetical protein
MNARFEDYLRMARLGLGATALGAAGLLILAACGASPRRGGVQDGQPATAQNGGMTDASYDWHGLMLAPFGTLLKESPIALHEVLLFQDESSSAAAADTAGVDTKDCYGTDGAPPRFLGHKPDAYLLCFVHDRLTRIDASVRMTRDEAAQVFAQACALWLKDTAPLHALGNTCEGRDGGIAFSARLGSVPEEPAASLSMTLSNAAADETVRDAARVAPREK